MPTPTQVPILRAKDFAQDAQVDQAAINIELDVIINALNAVIGNLSDVRRADGQLKSVLADVAAAAALLSQQETLLLKNTTQALHDVVVLKEALMNPHYAAIDNINLNMAAVLGAAQAALDAAASASISTTQANNAAVSATTASGAAATAKAQAAIATNKAAAAAQSAIDTLAALAQAGNPIAAAEKAAANGVAPLDAASKVPNIHLPATALTQDIPWTQKGIAGGVPTLDAQKMLVNGHRQQPTITVTNFDLLSDDFEGYVAHPAGGALNSPANINGYLKVRKLSAVESVQELTCQTLGTVYMRNLSGGVWGKWSNVWYRPATYYNGWTDFAAPYNGVFYLKDNNGIVHLRGLMNSGATSTAGAYAFLLPSKYRPAHRVLALADVSTSISRVDIHCNLASDGGLDGAVRVYGNGFTWVSFNNISFKAR